MRNTRSHILLLIATLVIIVASTALVSMRGQGKRNAPRGDHAQQKFEFESRFPVAEYDAQEPDDPKERLKRKSKDNRFRQGVLDELPGVTESEIVDGSGVARRPALPVALSNIIIIGNILNARAYLSSNKTGIFSEFTISIDEVLKTTGSDQVLPGANILAEREGGRIRYPSGRVRWIRFAHEGMPSNGGRYLFFLRRTEQEGIYVILTGYELRAGKVFPLDGVAPFEEHKLPMFAPYDGVEEAVFLKTIRDSL
ncbi:MAG TPA: hypothetical protein VJT71_02535 [Pyrinomonadaceae bacterium]|nr:hypothetical protein [Pyrinomonadaceae bacterium]